MVADKLVVGADQNPGLVVDTEAEHQIAASEVLLSDRIVMMTNGPSATIGEILSVRLDRPRERVALAQNPLYIEYRTSVLEFLYHRQANPATKEAA